MLATDDAQFLAMRVVRERFDHVRTGMHEVAVDLRHDLRVIEHRLGHERARLHVAAPLEFEQVTFGADDGAIRQPLEQTFALCLPVVGFPLRLIPTGNGCCSRRTSCRRRSDRGQKAAIPRRSCPPTSSLATSLPTPIILKP